jgi:hypothetical protein
MGGKDRHAEHCRSAGMEITSREIAKATAMIDNYRFAAKLS